MLVSNGVRALGEHGPVTTVAQRIGQLVDRLNQRYCAAEKVSIAVIGCGDCGRACTLRRLPRSLLGRTQAYVYGIICQGDFTDLRLTPRSGPRVCSQYPSRDCAQKKIGPQRFPEVAVGYRSGHQRVGHEQREAPYSE